MTVRKAKVKMIIISALATVFFAVAFSFQTVTVSATVKTFTIVAGNKSYVLTGKELGYYNGKAYVKCLEGVVDGIFYDTAVFPVDATVGFSPNKDSVFSFTSEKLGRGVDKEKLIDDVNLALSKNETSVVASFIELKPTVTVQDLKRYTYKLASFSTYYSVSSNNRKQNIKIATEKINGKILRSGEEFSFNKTVGERTEKNGFLSATVIENGEFLDGVGGGVCQVSTTLYNCALLSGLKTTERHAHSLVPSYIEPSFDAMVSGNVCDLKFINNTNGNVYIKAVADGEKLTFVFFGEKPKFTFERLSNVLETISPPSDEVIEDETLEVGETICVKSSKDGLKSEGYILAKDYSGNISKIKLHTDVYKSVRGQVRVGVDKTLEVG